LKLSKTSCRQPGLVVDAETGGAVLHRENVQYHPPSIDALLEARRLFELLLPVVPSAGLLFDLGVRP
jgi:hypothetical protein